jgi:hypothetical protein
MNRQQFAAFIRNPELTDTDSIPMFEDLTERYPYCQIAHLLYTFNLYRADSLRYPVQLKKAAAYAGDRRMLKRLIESARHEIALPAHEEEELPVHEEAILTAPQHEEVSSETDFGAVTTEELESIPAAEYTTQPTHIVTWEFQPPVSRPRGPLVTPDQGSQERLTQEELLSIVKRRLAEMNVLKHAEPNQESGDAEQHVLSSSDEFIGSTKKDLIDKFIREEPRISKPKATFFNPTDSAIRSNYDDEDIVSETLALLYAEQGNIPKAIHIYQKLSLLNQEKSRYFAAQIEKLKT